MTTDHPVSPEFTAAIEALTLEQLRTLERVILHLEEQNAQADLMALVDAVRDMPVGTANSHQRRSISADARAYAETLGPDALAAFDAETMTTEARR